jgi:hypothetical protein
VNEPVDTAALRRNADLLAHLDFPDRAADLRAAADRLDELEPIARLGRVVQEIAYVTGVDVSVMLSTIYSRAGVERPS